MDKNEKDITNIYDKIKLEIYTILIGLGEYVKGCADDYSIMDVSNLSIRLDFVHKDETKAAKDIANKGEIDRIQDLAQEAFEHLLKQSKKFKILEEQNFKVFELLFYKLIVEAYKFQRYSAHSEQLIKIEVAKEYLDNNHYNYIKKIYEILQLEFEAWIIYRNYILEDKPTQKIKAARYGTYIPIYMDGIPQQISKQEYWKRLKELATEASNFLPKGELSIRIMLIADVKLIFETDYSEEENKPTIRNLVKYLHVRRESRDGQSIIDDCTQKEFFIPECECNVEEFPYVIARNSKKIAKSELKNEEEEKGFLDCYFKEITLLPATFYSSKALWYIASEKENFDKVEKLNTELTTAQEDKKQVIAQFAHTYGNMQATTLYDIGTELLSVDNDLLHKWGRKIMVEYAIKQDLTKEVEILKLQFEDKLSELIRKLKESISIAEGKTIYNLVSDSLQRCFMSLLYGETRRDKRMRELFFGTEEYQEKRKALQEKFEHDILVSEQSMLCWLKENDILDISVSLSGIWSDMHFETSGYAGLLITNWITELLVNTIKYADKRKSILLSFQQNNEVLIMGINNSKEQSAINIHGTQNGVSSINASIQKLNQAVGCDLNTILIEEDTCNYNLQLFLHSKVFID